LSDSELHLQVKVCTCRGHMMSNAICQTLRDTLQVKVCTDHHMMSNAICETVSDIYRWEYVHVEVTWWVTPFVRQWEILYRWKYVQIVTWWVTSFVRQWATFTGESM